MALAHPHLMGTHGIALSHQGPALISCSSVTIWKLKKIFLAMPHGLWDLSSSNPCPLQWKHKDFTIGTPGKTLDILKQLSAVRWMTSPLPKDHIRRKVSADVL